jgi:DNA-binding SARP family transcriptional activator
MDTLHRQPLYLQDNEPEVAASVRSLIQRGLDYLLSGNNAEGISLLVQAQTRLAFERTEVVSLLKATIDICARYNQAQEALLDAVRNYAKEEARRQTQLNNLADMLATHNEQRTTTSSTITPLHRHLAHRHEEQEHSPSTGKTTSTLALSTSTPTTQGDHLPALSITCFGQFTVRRDGQLLELCRSRNGQATLRYLATQPGYRATADALMAALWPDEEPDVARRRLQIAISSLRGSLNEGYNCDPGCGYILCKNQLYQISSSVALQTDVDEFVRLYSSGQRTNWPHMIIAYEQACHLYRGPFLVEDIYADWSMRRREQLSQMYLNMCGILSKHFFEVGQYEDARRWASAMLDENRCDEDAHRQLMHAYAAEGRRSDALRQYHICEQTLMEELGVAPMPETLQIYQNILLGQIAST